MATRVKRYEAPLEQFDALLARIESEMGPDARLETREFKRGGIAGIGGQRMVEVVASVNVDVLAGPAPRSARGPAPLASRPTDPALPSGREPRWATPGISIQADSMASPFESATKPAPKVAPLLSDYRPTDLRRTEASAPRAAATADSRMDQQLEVLKGELARLQQSGESRPQRTPLIPPPARIDPAQAQIEELRATVAQLAESMRQVAAERNAAQQAQTLAQSSSSFDTPQTGLVAETLQRQGQMASQGGGGFSLPRSMGMSSLGGASIMDDQDRPIETPVEAPPEILKPRGDLLRPEVDEDDDSRLWELVEPVRLKADRAAGEVSLDEAQLMDLPLLPSMTSPVDAEAAQEQLDKIKQRAYLRLLNSNIDSSHALELIERAATELATHMRFSDSPAELVEEALLTEIQGEICREILIGGGIELRGALPGKVVALVGPTGVGKSTCIAKLAAHFAFQRGRSVGLVSLDTYRIAAAEQLKTYAEIMGLPIQVVYSADEFDEALTAARARYELTLVDTAGASPLGGRQLVELGKTFSLHAPDEVHLVLSATTKADDLRLVLENFRLLGYSRLILSKLDETRGLGALYNVNRYASAPISYFAVGQGVPEDLRVAELEFIQHWVTTGAVK